MLEKIVATIPVKRLGKPEEIASIIAWLAGEDSGFTTGADFSVQRRPAHGLTPMWAHLRCERMAPPSPLREGAPVRS